MYCLLINLQDAFRGQLSESTWLLIALKRGDFVGESIF